MMVLVDTPVWSLALRRKAHHLSPLENKAIRSLEKLIREGTASIVGPVRQELLSGIRDQAQFEKLREYLRAFDEPVLASRDYEAAAEIHNHCRRRGIAGSPIDFLLCAVAEGRTWQIFTTDLDFERYAGVRGVRLYDAG
jgi:predicted nucleic acid-binding protein